MIIDSNPLISVIVPVYNAGSYLKRCIDSILAQTYDNLEIILVDDGSTDGSGKICEEYATSRSGPGRIVKAIHQKNGGPGQARNAGLDNADGSYISFVDSDDKIEQGMYERLLAAMLKNNAAIGQCLYYVVNKKKIVPSIELNENAIIDVKGYYNSKFSRPVVWDKLFTREIIGEARFNEDVLPGFEDHLFLLNVFINEPTIVIINEIHYYYNMIKGSATHGHKANTFVFRHQLSLMTELQEYCKFARIKYTAGDNAEKLIDNLMVMFISLFYRWENYFRKTESQQHVEEVQKEFDEFLIWASNKKCSIKARMKIYLLKHKGSRVLVLRIIAPLLRNIKYIPIRYRMHRYGIEKQ